MKIESSVESSMGLSTDAASCEKVVVFLTRIFAGKMNAAENGTTIKMVNKLTNDAQNNAQFRAPPFLLFLRVVKMSDHIDPDLRKRVDAAGAPPGLESLAYGSVRFMSLIVVITSKLYTTAARVGMNFQVNRKVDVL
jgi:hypothetical protein